MQKQGRLIHCFLLGMVLTIMLAAFDQPGGAFAKSPRVLGPAQIGGDVRQLQIELDKKGYHLKPFDGIYGLRTQQAVLDFQRENGLKPTGTYNRQTAKALKEGGSKTGMPMRAKTVVSRGVSREEIKMLARAVHGEARGEKFEGQVAVAAVIVNRARSGQFPDTINGVVFESGAFDAVDDGQIWLEPDNKAVKAAEMALAGYDPTGGALYYWNPVTSTSKWIWTRAIEKQIGRHVFAR